MPFQLLSNFVGIWFGWLLEGRRCPKLIIQDALIGMGRRWIGYQMMINCFWSFGHVNCHLLVMLTNHALDLGEISSVSFYTCTSRQLFNVWLLHKSTADRLGLVSVSVVVRWRVVSNEPVCIPLADIVWAGGRYIVKCRLLELGSLHVGEAIRILFYVELRPWLRYYGSLDHFSVISAWAHIRGSFIMFYQKLVQITIV